MFLDRSLPLPEFEGFCGRDPREERHLGQQHQFTLLAGHMLDQPRPLSLLQGVARFANRYLDL